MSIHALCYYGKMSVAQLSQILGISSANQPITALFCILSGKSNLSECIFYGTMQMGQLEQV